MRETVLSAITVRRCLVIPAILVAAAITSFGAQAGDDRQEASSRDLEDDLKALRSVPYTTVTKDESDPGKAGVVRFKPSKSYRGYNLYVSPLNSEVVLMDMTGTVVNRWGYDDGPPRVWDFARMLDNGDVVVIRKFHDLIKLDWDSKLVWRNEIKLHHEITILPDSTIYVIGREVHNHRRMRIRFPAIVHLTGDGKEIARWSTFANLDEIKRKFDQRSFIDTLLDSLLADGVDPETWEPLTAEAESIKAELDAWPLRYDQFHMNTISILPETPLGRSDPRFRAGNLLICFRNVNQIAVLEKNTKEILWVWGEGDLDWPHHPTMLENGRILVFDNGTRKRKYTRLIELNPVTLEIEWEYVGDPPETFYTPERGSSQRLPNGNTLVCEGDRGRCFEITAEGEIVWEWYNPTMKGKRREQVYRMERIPPEIVGPLLEARRQR
jgi:hypothetical protein